MRIMIADDAGFIRQIIRDVYTRAGHEIVAEATNGPDAVMFALEKKPELLIVDIVLPELNGLEVAAEISRQDTDILMAATSSLTNEWIEENSKNAGCFYFMRKPFTKDELLRVIDLARLVRGGELKHG